MQYHYPQKIFGLLGAQLLMLSAFVREEMVSMQNGNDKSISALKCSILYVCLMITLHISASVEANSISQKTNENYKKQYLTFEAITAGTFSLTIDSGVNTEDVISISYSLNGGDTWATTYNIDNQKVVITTPTVNAGNKVLWKGEGLKMAKISDDTHAYNHSNFSSTGTFIAYGNIMSLLYGDDFECEESLSGRNSCYYNLFGGNTGLTSAEDLVLPATALADSCYYSMFGGCTSLVAAPELPAKELANRCYEFMFANCTSLVNAPKLPAVTLAPYCYSFMFLECTSLVSVPELLATTLAPYCCYAMFEGCSSITTVPLILPATVLENHCYACMFSGCKSLTTAPILPATVLEDHCYQSMFRRCTSLRTAPSLPASKLTAYCYQGMFNGCTSLSYIKCLATSIGSDAYMHTSSWLKNVSPTGTFVKASSMDNWEDGIDGVPYDWIIRNANSIPQSFSQDGINYELKSATDYTVNVGKADYSGHVVIPTTVRYDGDTWIVAGVVDGAFNLSAITAITWNPNTAIGDGAFGAQTNPNLLLYVKSEAYAPTNVQNVIANGRARKIVLTDAASGNDFNCPEAFTAEEISYTHRYGMTTGIGECRGWETIALPFTVQKVTHKSKGELVTFKQWDQSTSAKPYWLYKLTYTGFVEADFIEANTPYVISMPNHEKYFVDYILAGNVTFSAENATVKTSENMTMPTCNDKTFRPCFAKTAQSGVYAINAVNSWVTNTGGYKEGSVFIDGLRPVLPFEAYMTTNAANAKGIIPIFETQSTAIREIPMQGVKGVRIYSLSGELIMFDETISIEEALKRLKRGVYFVNGKKMVVSK